MNNKSQQDIRVVVSGFKPFGNVNADLHISITHDRNNTKESCKKNPLSLVNGDELPEQSWSVGTRKKTEEEINGTRGYPVFMAVAE